MKTITFYSYKGGVGRSLALVNIATRLSEMGQKVCIIDFDLDAPGLHFKLQRAYEIPKVMEVGLVDYIYHYAVDGIVEKKIKDFSYQLKPKNPTSKPITFVPAGNIESNDYWQMLSFIPWSKLFYAEDSEGVDFFLDLKAKIEAEFDPDFLLIDSRTGITDIAAITLKIFADEVVVLAANNEENLFGCKRILKNLYDPDHALFGTAPKITFVLTRLPFDGKDLEKEIAILENIKREMLTALNTEFFEYALIRSDSSLEIKEETMMGYEYENGSSIGNDYLKLFDIVTTGTIDSFELLRFNQARAADKEFNKGQVEKDTLKKINYFNAAISLNNKKSNYFLARGLVYSQGGFWDEAIKDFKMVGKIDDTKLTAVNIGYCYYRKKDYETALNYLDQNNGYQAIVLKTFIYLATHNYDEAMFLINFLLSKYPEDHEILNARATVYRDQGKFDLALQDVYRAIDMSPKNKVYYATLAEINALQGKIDEFYLNLTVALNFGLELKNIESETSVYNQFINDERFLNLFQRYNIDTDELQKTFKIA